MSDTAAVTFPVVWGAERLGVTEAWYTRQLRARKLPGHKIGRTWRLTEGDVQAALDITFVAPIIPVKDPAGLSSRSRRLLQNRTK